MKITLEHLLSQQYLREDYSSYYPEKNTDEDFRVEITRLFNDWDKHPWDCKCLICV
jgi:hypothetical protein